MSLYPRICAEFVFSRHEGLKWHKSVRRHNALEGSQRWSPKEESRLNTPVTK